MVAARITVVLAAALALAPGGGAHERTPMPCVYLARATAVAPAPELQSHPACGWLDEDGHAHFAPAHLTAMAYGDDGLAEVALGGHWYYVTPDGEALEVLTVDNGPDPFAEGLVRGRRRGKVAYFDSSFAVVIPPRYNWGWPFEDGYALVCSGCALGPREGEHAPVVGGAWGWIDATGREVVPVTCSREQALAQRPKPKPAR